MSASTILRWVLSVALLAGVWCGNKWAFCLAVTLIFISDEITGYAIKKLSESLRASADALKEYIKSIERGGAL